ncbi:hypothetical protein [Cryobacterium zhongshanensis]|uniref:Uncharacterized protein n=1 Tax=Cryobacterium zhongshanensis TaxID=2928153 RepID=A0AA41QZN0_9MICO|nr:hypothetical protein [Cryobacterium zhongshanensis]MCI4659764.1 hypothetical protein [Cryobacterium zhongshanensis]
MDTDIRIETDLMPEIKDRAELASETGFTGTLAAFLQWLDDACIYGGVVIHEPSLNSFGHPIIKVETVTCGYSSDEHLLGRVAQSVLVRSRWVSSHRGGLVVYEFPTDWVASVDEQAWLEPESDVFDTVYRVRRVRLYDTTGYYVEMGYDGVAELLFSEPDRDINEPAGLLIIRPAVDQDVSAVDAQL